MHRILQFKNLKFIFSLIFFTSCTFLLDKHLNAFGASSPPKAEKDFLKNNLVIINSPSGQSTGSILGKLKNTYYIITTKHGIDNIKKGDEIDIQTGDGNTFIASIVPNKKLVNLDMVLLSFKSDKCYPVAYIGAENFFWATEMSPQSQPIRMVVAGYASVDPFVSRKPVLRVTPASISVNIPAEDSNNGYQFGYNAPTARGMSGGAVFTDSSSIRGGRCFGNCNQPYGYHLVMHGRGERDNLRSSAKTGYNYGIPTAFYATGLFVQNDLEKAMNISTLYISRTSDEEKDSIMIPKGMKKSNRCLPQGLLPLDFVDYSNNREYLSILKDKFNKL